MIDPDRIGGLVMDVIPKNSCLIFCSSRKNCENVALLLSKLLFKLELFSYFKYLHIIIDFITYICNNL